MKKRIIVRAEVVRSIMKDFEVSRPTLTRALRYDYPDFKAHKVLRKVALERGGKIEHYSSEDYTPCDDWTFTTESRIMMWQHNTHDVRIELNALNGDVVIEKFSEVVKMDSIIMIDDILEVLESVEAELSSMDNVKVG